MRGEGNPMYGKKHSEETKNFLSNYAKNIRDNSVYRTDDFKRKISEVTKGEKNGMYGKKHTELSKEKMSEQQKGKHAGEKNGMYGHKGDNALNGKKIEMLDAEGNVLRVFNAKTAILSFLGLKGHTQLDKAIKNGCLYKGYYWRKMCRD